MDLCVVGELLPSIHVARSRFTVEVSSYRSHSGCRGGPERVTSFAEAITTESFGVSTPRGAGVPQEAGHSASRRTQSRHILFRRVVRISCFHPVVISQVIEGPSALRTSHMRSFVRGSNQGTESRSSHPMCEWSDRNLARSLRNSSPSIRRSPMIAGTLRVISLAKPL